MNKLFVRAVFAATLSMAAAGAASMIFAGVAQAAPKVSKEVAGPLVAAQKLSQAGDYQGALAQIRIAQAVPDRTPFEDLEINNFLGFIAINLKDYPTATVALEAAADSPEVANLDSSDDRMHLFHNAILLSGQAQHWAKVITYAQTLDTLKGGDDITYAVTAQAYYFTKDTADALVWAQKSIDAAKAAGKKPEEAALQIVMNGQAKTDQGAAQQTLENLAVNYGSPESWSQLVNIAMGSGGVKPLDALYLYRLKFAAGAMSSVDDYKIMASVADQLGYFTEAVRVSEQGIQSGKISHSQTGLSPDASSKAAADERSLPGYAAAAAKSSSGLQDVLLAEDYYGYGRYSDAEEAARRGMSKGGNPKEPYEAQMILGISLARDGKYDEAISTLAQVSGSAARTKTAHVWTLYAQSRQKAAGAATPAPASH
jgi:tetratricopeptide (TPR) repeat protein